MKRPTAEVGLPVDANQKREVWQPLPCAQQSHSLINKVALSESLLRVRTSGLAPAHPGKLPNPPVAFTHARTQAQQHPSPWHHFERVLHRDIISGGGSCVGHGSCAWRELRVVQELIFAIISVFFTTFSSVIYYKLYRSLERSLSLKL